jgi:hypothetical protein
LLYIFFIYFYFISKHNKKATMMTEQCAICLQDLNNDIGTFVPCGHCIHVSCYKEYEANHQEKRLTSGRSGQFGSSFHGYNSSTSSTLPRCPVCLSSSTHFQRLYFSFGEHRCGDDNSTTPSAPYPGTVLSSSSNTNPNVKDSTYSPFLGNYDHNRPGVEQDHRNTNNCQHLSMQHFAHDLYHVARKQHQTMLIQREINLIQKQVADIHAMRMMARANHLQAYQQQQNFELERLRRNLYMTEHEAGEGK